MSAIQTIDVMVMKCYQNWWNILLQAYEQLWCRIRNTRPNTCGTYAQGGYNTNQMALQDRQKLTVSSEQHKNSVPWSAKYDKPGFTGGLRITIAKSINEFWSWMSFRNIYLWLLPIVQHSSSVGINIGRLVFHNSFKVFDKPVKARTQSIKIQWTSYLFVP
jgi:hypothetical protein